MKYIKQVLMEQFQSVYLIFRLAIFEIKSRYLMHYLGVIWQFLVPATQIFVYWFVIGIGIRGGKDVNGYPYFIWLIVGLIPWLFINRAIIQGSNSVVRKINLVSRLNFPVSILPSINIVSNAINFLVMFFIMILFIFINNVNITAYLLQLPYYIFCMFILVFSLSLLGSTISLFVRDIQSALPQIMRVIFYLSPVLWDTSHLPLLIQTILKLNPFYYIIEGFRFSIFSEGWFYEDLVYTFYFWAFTFFTLLIGSIAHIKYRKSFVDYL